ncbi:MAG: helicase-related protein [Candidatus Woesearchaeota archaeon]
MSEILIEHKTADPTIDLALDTLKIKKQALVFANTKRSAEKTAEDISKQIKDSSEELEKLSKDIKKVLAHPTKQCERLAKCIEKGIAFHHAGLTHKQKELIEDNFRVGIIRIICCTPTLAFGLDLPAFRAIMKDLRRFGHRGLDWIPTLEYLQMAGRAGRPKFDKYGEAIAIAKTEPAKKEIEKRYINGKPEEIFSKLAVEPVLRTYILSLIATGFVRTEKDMIKFFSKTFWAFQYQDMNKLSSIIRRMLGLLEEYKFIESNEEQEEFQSASDMYNYSYKPTLIGKRVAELYIDPLTAHFLMGCIEKATKIKINEFSFLQAVSHTLEMRPLLRVRVKEFDIIEEELLKQSDYLLELMQMYDPEYDDYLNSVKTAIFLKDWINEKDEEYLLETYNVRPGEIRVKQGLADWLLYCTEELTRMLEHKEIIKEIIKLRIRLKHGAKEELLPLLRLKNIGRVRARKLFKAGIKDIREIKKAEAITLAQLVGRKTALSIKEQVGQKIKTIPKGTRKGQTSIKKFN